MNYLKGISVWIHLQCFSIIWKSDDDIVDEGLMKIDWTAYYLDLVDEIFRLQKVLIVLFNNMRAERENLMLKCYKYLTRGSVVGIKYENLQFNQKT